MKTTRELRYLRIEQSGGLMAYVWSRAEAEDLSTRYLPVVQYTAGEVLTVKSYHEVIKGCCYA